MQQFLPRRFSVHAPGVDHNHARIVEERSFEAAALAYLEDFVLAAHGDDRDVSVIVRDLESGHEHRICVDLENGEAADCG